MSTGDILRSEIANQTQLGLEAKSFMDAGKLVPDAVVIGSRIVQLLEEAAPAQRVQLLEDFLKDIRKALDQ